MLTLVVLQPIRAPGQSLTQSMNESRKVLQDAISLEQQGELSRARSQYKRAIRLNPGNIKAFDHYSLFLYKLKKFSEGAKVVKIGYKLNPDKKELLSLLGMHLYRLGKIDEAFSAFENGAASTDRYEIQAVHALCAMKVEDYVTAVKAFGNYLNSRPGSLSKRDFIVRTYLSLALMRTRSIRAAEKQLSKVLSDHPTYRRAQIARAELHLRKGQCARAVQAYRKLQPRFRNNELALRIGQAYLCLKRYRDALTMADRFLANRMSRLNLLLSRPAGSARYKRDVKNMVAGLVLRGDAAMRLKQYRQALEDYKKTERLSGGVTSMVLRVAQAHHQLREYGKVVDMLSVELKKPDTPLGVIVLLLRAAVRTKRLPLAEICTGRLLKRKRPSAELYYLAGMANNTAGKFKVASTHLERALKLNPKHRRARIELVRAYCFQARRELRSQRLQAAISYLLKAKKSNPRSPHVHRALAVVHLRQRRAAQALIHAQTLLDLLPKDPIASRLAGRALALQGKHRDALVWYGRALRDVRDDTELRAKILIEEGISRIRAKMIEQGISRLEQASKLMRDSGGNRDLIAAIQRNIIRANCDRGREALTQGYVKKASRSLTASLGQSSQLPKQERMVMETLATLGTIFSGNIGQARQMIQKYRPAFESSLRPPYNKIGLDLLTAYSDFFNRGPQIRKRAAAKLEQLAGRVGMPARDTIGLQASSTYAQLGDRYFRLGQPRQARAMYARAQRLTKAETPVMRHNKAVIDYYTGNQNDALRALQGATKQVGLAYCNLAVHHERMGAMKESYTLFSQCDRKGGHIFPNLKQILDIKLQLFGKLKSPGGR